jgi:hypothetical protein
MLEALFNLFLIFLLLAALATLFLGVAPVLRKMIDNLPHR